MVTVSILVLALLTPSQAADTVVYREISEGERTLDLPQSSSVTGSWHDATIAVAWVWADSAHAWYEALDVRSTYDGEETRPATDGALGLEFVLRFDDEGNVETLSSPDFPAGIDSITDLSRQFDDFFMPRPPAPLAPGVAWADTLTRTDTAADGSVFRFARAGAYEVTGDSVVSGHPVWVVRSSVRQSSAGRGSGPDPGVTWSSEMSGHETGVFFIHRRAGFMVGRSRTAELLGRLRYTVRGRTLVVPTIRVYSNSVELVERRP